MTAPNSHARRVATVLTLYVLFTACLLSGLRCQKLPYQKGNTMDIPYEVSWEIWRNEQPGDSPSVHVSIRMDLKAGETPWEQTEVVLLEIRGDFGAWEPPQAELRAAGDGQLEVAASGEASIPAGAEVEGDVEFVTRQGAHRIRLPRRQVTQTQ